MGTMAGLGFSINGLPPRALCYKQDVSSIGPVFKVGHKHSLSSRGSHLGKYWNLSYGKPKCGVLSVTPRATANKDYVREMVITGGLQVPIQLSSTAWDMGCTAMVMAGAYTLVSTFDVLTKSNILDQKLSRKLVHISSGLLFMMSWPLFSASTNSRYLAAFVPLANLVRLLIYGLALAKNEGLVKAVSRDGNPKELLRGPLYYVIVLMFCTVVFWRESPIGVVALAMMCGGDGIADIVGRRFGRIKLPYNRDKSWAGSISMFLFGLLISLGIIRAPSMSSWHTHGKMAGGQHGVQGIQMDSMMGFYGEDIGGQHGVQGIQMDSMMGFYGEDIGWVLWGGYRWATWRPRNPNGLYDGVLWGGYWLHSMLTWQ